MSFWSVTLYPLPGASTSVQKEGGSLRSCSDQHGASRLRSKSTAPGGRGTTRRRSLASPSSQRIAMEGCLSFQSV